MEQICGELFCWDYGRESPIGLYLPWTGPKLGKAAALTMPGGGGRYIRPGDCS